MAKVVFKIHMSVDGFVGAPDGDIGGLMVHRDEEARDWQLELVRGAGVHVMGRVLYDHMAGFWPSSTDPFAAPMNEIPKVVFSATLSDPGWGPVRVDSGPLGAGIARLRRENEKPVLVHGGASAHAAHPAYEAPSDIPTAVDGGSTSSVCSLRLSARSTVTRSPARSSTSPRLGSLPSSCRMRPAKRPPPR